MAAVKYEQKSWSLDELFPGLGTPEIEQALEKLDASAANFEKHREQLTADIAEEKFVSILQDYEGITRQISRVGAFADLKFSEDTQDQKVQAFMAQMQQLGAQIDNRTMFFNLWWKKLDDKAAARLLEASGDYRYWLEALRLQKPYTLSEPEEKIINLKDVNGAHALVTLHSTITNRYCFQLEVDGEEKELSREELHVYYRDPDPALREAAYKELYRVYEADGPILGQIYQSILRDRRSEGVDLRGYSSPIALRNLANDIPDDVVETLAATISTPPWRSPRKRIPIVTQWRWCWKASSSLTRAWLNWCSASSTRTTSTARFARASALGLSARRSHLI
jgi:oligoendopeptidase F